MDSLFRLVSPSPGDLECFDNDGYIYYPNVLKDAAREALIKEILHLDAVEDYVQDLPQGPAAVVHPYFVRPWNERGDRRRFARRQRRTLGRHQPS